MTLHEGDSVPAVDRSCEACEGDGSKANPWDAKCPAVRRHGLSGYVRGTFDAEAAPPHPRYGPCDGFGPEQACSECAKDRFQSEAEWLAWLRSESAEAAPPRATTPEPTLEDRLEFDVDAIRCALGLFRNFIRPSDKMDMEEYRAAQIGLNNLTAEIARLREKNNRLALESITVAARQHFAPSRESGALLTAEELEHLEGVLNDGEGVQQNDHALCRENVALLLTSYRVLDASYYAIERDAARMRGVGGILLDTEINRVGEFRHGGYVVTYTDDADLCAWLLPIDSDDDAEAVFSDGDEGLREAFDWLAALSPSGEPTTTPETGNG